MGKRDWGYDSIQLLYQGVGAVERKAIDSKVLAHASHRFYGDSPKGVYLFRLFVKLKRRGARKRVYEIGDNIEIEFDGLILSWLVPKHVLESSRRIENFPNFV